MLDCFAGKILILILFLCIIRTIFRLFPNQACLKGFLLSLNKSHPVPRTKGFPQCFLGSPDGLGMVPRIAMWGSPNDPKPKDPKLKDAKPKDPKLKDPKSENPKAKDPKPKYPNLKDPKHKDPKPKDPKP